MANKELNKSCKNIAWQRNQALIQEIYIELVKELKRCPTILEVSEGVNLSVNTINKHIKKLKFEPLKSPLRSLTPDVLMSIVKSARRGSSASQKLWLQVMEGWAEKTEVKMKLEAKIIPITQIEIINGRSKNPSNDNTG